MRWDSLEAELSLMFPATYPCVPAWAAGAQLLQLPGTAVSEPVTAAAGQ